MNKRKQFALNKLFGVCIIFGVVLAWLSVEFLGDSETAWGIGSGIGALLLTVLASIFTPFCYSFDSEGVSLCYVFFPVERYLWKDIYAIEVEYKSSGSRAGILDFFFASVFSIKGKNVDKTRFYMKGRIRKSFRTKRLLEKYWDGTITGYLLEDVKKWINKRKAKKHTQIKSHLTDEVVTLEREARVEAREWLKPLASQAKQYDLDIKTKYFYVTKDFEELKSRPQKGYTYTLIAEVAHFNETDENRIVVISVDLLHVRLGKTSYRGVKSKHAQEELQITLSDVLNEISKNGIESFCKSN